MHLAGKVVLITGGSDGIGAACAAAFRRRGARLVLTARNAVKLKQVAQGDELTIAADLLLSDSRQAIVDEALRARGAIDVLVNNAGAGLYAKAHDAPMESVRELFELNFFAPLQMAQLVAPIMRQQKSGTIVNVSSIAGKVPLPWFTLYSSSKYALGCLTDGLRIELKRDGVHTLTVCPGYVKTDFQKHAISGRPPLGLQQNRPFSITAEQCAEAIVRGVERNARSVVTPPTGWFFIAAARLFPTLVDRQLERIYRATR